MLEGICTLFAMPGKKCRNEGRQNELKILNWEKSEMDGNVIYHFTKIKTLQNLKVGTGASENGGNDRKKRKYNSADNFFL